MEKSNKTVTFTARIPEEFRTYLNEISWRNRTTVTAYINKLIAEDMEKNPDWKKDLDALSGAKK